MHDERQRERERERESPSSQDNRDSSSIAGTVCGGHGVGASKQEKRTVSSPCATNAGEIYGSGRTRAKQEQGGASNVRATQRDADGSRHALERSADIKDA